MAYELSSLDLYYLTKELKVVESGRIDKIHQYSLQEFLFRIRTSQEKTDLKIVLPSTIYIAEKREDSPIRPMGYCTFLRKYIEGAIIRTINQKGFERILELELESKGENYLLVIELIKPGNIILCKNGEILAPLTSKNYKNRTMKRGEKYEYPPEQPDITSKSDEELSKLVKESTKTIVKCLAIDFGLGGVYAEEALKQVSFEKNTKATKLSVAQVKEVVAGVKHLLNRKLEPVVDGDKVHPFKLSGGTGMSSFSSALESTIAQKEIKSPDVSKYEVIVEAQKKRIRALEKEAEESQKTGDFIYEKYSELNEYLTIAKPLIKDKQKLLEYLKTNKNFKEYNEKEKKVILEF